MREVSFARGMTGAGVNESNHTTQDVIENESMGLCLSRGCLLFLRELICHIDSTRTQKQTQAKGCDEH